jgi:hypothetical protein
MLGPNYESRIVGRYARHRWQVTLPVEAPQRLHEDDPRPARPFPTAHPFDQRQQFSSVSLQQRLHFPAAIERDEVRRANYHFQAAQLRIAESNFDGTLRKINTRAFSMRTFMRR